MAPVALHPDADGRAMHALKSQKLGPRQPERDQQDLVDPGMERRRHLSQQHLGGFGIQRLRQAPGAQVGVRRRLHRGQRGRGRRHLPPRVGLLHDFWCVCVLGQQRRPPRKRCAARR